MKTVLLNFMVCTEQVPTFTNKNTFLSPLVSSQVNRMLDGSEVPEQQLVTGGLFDVPGKVSLPVVSTSAYLPDYISPPPPQSSAVSKEAFLNCFY